VHKEGKDNSSIGRNYNTTLTDMSKGKRILRPVKVKQSHYRPGQTLRV